MHHQDHEPILVLAPVAALHAFDLLGDVGRVYRSEVARAQEATLLDSPSVEVFLVANQIAGHY
jgi:hypothetical protein